MAVNFYGLTGKPFGLSPDPAFCFGSAAHRKALSHIAYGLDQGEGVIVITGEAGLGKSTLAGHLVGSIDRQRLTVAQLVPGHCDESGLMGLVAQSFGLAIDGQDSASVNAALEGFLCGEARAGRRGLLIVDEAHDLSIEALEQLRVLANLELADQPLVQILLLGRPALRATLRGAALDLFRKRIVAAHHLEPIDRIEIEPYMAYRLQRVGWTGNPQFDQRVFAELHQASGGIPLHINRVADRLLVLGAIGQRTRIDAVILKAALDELAIECSETEVAPGPNPLPTAHLDRATFDALLAERDAQIVELQQAVVELANQQDRADAGQAEVAALAERIARLESRVTVQESSICQTLSMLIEWIEGEPDQTRAA